MIYNISFDICAGVITIIALAEMLFSRDMERRVNRVLFTLIAMHLLSVIFDIWSSIANSYPLTHSLGLRNFTNYVFLAVHTSEAAVFLLFLLEQLGITAKMSVALRALLAAPEILMVLAPLLLNPLMHSVFAYDAHHVYIHGPGIILLYVAANIYMFMCIIIIVKYRSSLTIFQCNAAVSLLLLSIVPMLIQSIFMPHQLIEMFFQALGFYGYMKTVENTDDLRHPLTHAWNHQALIRDFTHNLINDVRMYGVLVKVSQTHILQVATRDSASFHTIRLSRAQWFSKHARALKLKFYDCEKGIYLVIGKEEKGKTACHQLVKQIEERFKETDELLPIQLSLVSFPDPEMSALDLFAITATPYIAQAEGITYASKDELLRSLHNESKQNDQPFPPELAKSMDTFLARVATLSPAERKIFDLYVAGYEVSEIPDQAFISINTVKKHNKNIYRKLGVGSREEIRLFVDLFYQCERGDELYTDEH